MFNLFSQFSSSPQNKGEEKGRHYQIIPRSLFFHIQRSKEHTNRRQTDPIQNWASPNQEHPEICFQLTWSSSLHLAYKHNTILKQLCHVPNPFPLLHHLYEKLHDSAFKALHSQSSSEIPTLLHSQETSFHAHHLPYRQLRRFVRSSHRIWPSFLKGL